MEEKVLENITQLMRKCGDIILHPDRTRLDTSSKEGLTDILPEAIFVGEEQENPTDIDRGLVFIVDPIDGTMNFIRNLHCSGISVALIKDEKGYMGAVLNPYLDEMYTAIRGKGAFLNGHPIHVSDHGLEEAGGVVFTQGRQPVGYGGSSGIFAANREENLLA